MAVPTRSTSYSQEGTSTMPIKPTEVELNAIKVMKSDPDFSKRTIETIINETPVLRDALLEAGLVEEVKSND